MSRKKIKVLPEDEEMIAALESTGYVSVKNEDAEIQRYAKIFRENSNKVKRVENYTRAPAFKY